MARATAGVPKQPGRVKQTWQIFQMTRKSDPTAPWWMLLGFVLSVAVGVVLALLLWAGSVLTLVLYLLLGVVTGGLVALIIMNRRAERAAYAQIEGQPGAVGAVLRTSLRRGWRGSEVPVAVNARTRDAVYRVVGRPGVVVIVEGPKARVQRLTDEERRRVGRVAPNVPVTVLYVGQEEGSIRLHQISRRLGRLKPKLTRAEVLAVGNRLDSLGTGLPLPKGIDPTKVRAVRR